MRTGLLFVVFLSAALACNPTAGTPMQQCVCGLVSAVGDINWQQCTSDLSQAGADFDSAVYSFAKGFNSRSTSEIKDGLISLAEGLRKIGAALDDCELATIAEDLAEIAAQFSSGWGEVEEGIKIIVKGFDIYDDIYDIVVDYENGEYFALGKKLYNLIEILA